MTISVTKAPLADAWAAANRLLGWGDEKTIGGVWFVGLEEASPWGKDYIISVASEDRGRFEPPKSHSKKETHRGATIEIRTAQIAATLSTTFRNMDPRRRRSEYRDRMLCQPHSGVCRVNLYPLGKATWNKWPDDYKEWFGFETVEEYREAAREMRRPILAKCFAAMKPQAVVCFGKEGWPEFRSHFGVDGQAPLFVERAPHGKGWICAKFYRSGADGPIIALTPFFTRPMTVELADKIAIRLFDLGVRLP